MHAVRVLRCRAGDEIQVVDGAGHWYRVCLNHVQKNTVIGTVLERRVGVNEPSAQLHIGLALLKSRQRFEVFLEKAVELGVTAITPLITERTEARSFRVQRARRILVAAMKQCRRCHLPRLSVPRHLDEVLMEEGSVLRCIAHQGPYPSLLEAVAGQELRGVSVLVGPEGGFTEEEVRYARGAGYTAVSLGVRRLRSETAAIACASTVTMHRSLGARRRSA